MTTETVWHDVTGPKGRFRYTETPEGWRVMEGFGSYRMLKKKFRTREAAEQRAREMAGVES